MKSLKKILIMCSFLFLVTGCFKTEELDNAKIYTTIYPIEYIVSELYGILTEEDEGAICKYFNVSTDTMKIYLSVLANYRNLCAHEDILYSNKTQRMIPDNHVHEILNIEKLEGEYIYGKNDLFSVIIMMKELLTKSDFNDFFNEFNYEMEILENKITTLSKEELLSKIGFPLNWGDIKEI